MDVLCGVMCSPSRLNCVLNETKSNKSGNKNENCNNDECSTASDAICSKSGKNYTLCIEDVCVCVGVFVVTVVTFAYCLSQQ